MARSTSSTRIPITGLAPDQVSNLLYWYEADQGITLDGSNNVSQWNDLSGNGSHLTQSSSSLRPAFISSSINSLPALRHTNAGGHTMTSTTTFAGGSTAHTMVAVFKENAAGPSTFNGVCYIGGAAASGKSGTIGQDNVNKLWFGVTGDGSPALFTLSNGSTYIAAKQVSGSVTSAWATNKKYVMQKTLAGSTYNISPATGFGTGKYHSASSGGNHDIALLFGYSRSITDAEMDGVLRYCRNKYVSAITRSAASTRAVASTRAAA